ncbi:MAG: alkaline phosphatase family protein [Ignavibacteriales bacterium]|nr:MAG: alkaline phosphatase family protein [Ignavibacteriales bacterium]
MKLYFLLIILAAFTFIYPQSSKLQSGPMVGYSEMREVALWLQTTQPAKVKISYWDKKNPKHKYFTDEKTTKKEEGFTSTLIADEVEPGRHYNYEVYIDEKPIQLKQPCEFQTLKLWQWREDPPEFSFVAGSCAYVNESQYDRPGKPYGGNYEIYNSIFERHPDFMVWLGDNYYLREPDWNSWTGIIKRITHTRSLPEMQPLLSSVHNYAIWDDHDFGPNNSDRSFIHKDLTLKAFKLFWPALSYGVNDKPGIASKFEWGDAEFFMMDDRYYRSPDDSKTGKRELLGKDQLKWLIEALVSSNATFKFIAIGGQVLSTEEASETYLTYKEEREELLTAIKNEGLTGVIFLTGDRHFSEITKLEREGTYPLYDFTLSTMSAGPSKPDPAKNTLRVPGTLVTERNFGLFKITGPKNDRVLNCKLFNKDGVELWSYDISANTLK